MNSEENNDYSVSLNCWECDHPSCRIGQAVLDSKYNGCVRVVDEKLFIEYYHQIKEVWPFALKGCKEQVDKEYQNTIKILDKIYASPVLKKYGRGFKVIVLKESDF